MVEPLATPDPDESGASGGRTTFFALGGRSLLLPHFRHRLEQEFGIRLPLASLLERTTA